MAKTVESDQSENSNFASSRLDNLGSILAPSRTAGGQKGDETRAAGLSGWLAGRSRISGGRPPPPPAAAAAAAGLGVNKSRRLRTRAGGDGAHQERPPLPGQATSADRAPARPGEALGSLCSPWAAPRVGPLPPAPAMVRISKPKTFQAYLDDCHRRYSCAHCRAHLANHDDLISKSFQGSQGRAYLFNSVVNVGCGPAEERVLLTGLHAVADIHCENCKTTLGWKYEQAFESSQKYKEGKYIIELNHMIKDNGWD
ncbi:protein yippee-like 3 [Puma concolor]|uniref:Protein yippee-like 3 n=1 Tax=Puma concolor TaxID=9696 RepID=A0A6P6HK20_PUMCO|nr:protein yippee-like 3 [Puma concolor]